jgi:peroxiredoxin
MFHVEPSTTKRRNVYGWIVMLLLALADCSPKPARNELPPVTLIGPDGKHFSAQSLPGNTILVFFGAGCDHCQREATEIHDHLKEFEGYTLYFISMDPFPVMDKFAQDFGISNQPNIRFLQADGSTVASALGYIQTPTIIAYDSERKLIKRFDGETKVEAILKAL